MFFAFLCLKVSKLSEIPENPCPKSDLGLGLLFFSSHDQTAHLLSQCVAALGTRSMCLYTVFAAKTKL